MSARRLGLIAVIALVVRVGYVLAFMRGYRPNSDADSFAIGRAVSDGQGYVFTLPFGSLHATAIRPPLYPTVIAGAFRVFGAHVGVAQGVNVVAGSAVAVLAALLANRISGPRAGLCAGIVVAVYPPLIAMRLQALVRSRYEHQSRAQDPSLETWEAVMSGTALERVRSALSDMH